MISKLKNRAVLLLLSIAAIAVTSCKKQVQEVEKESTDKWISPKESDSLGNRYYIAATKDNQLEIRIDDKQGNGIFSGVCKDILPGDIPESSKKAIVALTAPNKFISNKDATIAIMLINTMTNSERKYIQLLANINLETKATYTKVYRVEKPSDRAFAMLNRDVVHWYQNTLLVREGTDLDLLGGGGFMGLGQRGTELISYERDFSINYTKPIDVSAAYYPKAGDRNIPISTSDYIGFNSRPGAIARLAILVSAYDEYRGVKPTVWQVDLKQALGLPADYTVILNDCNVAGGLVKTNYTVQDGSGKTLRSESRDWDISTGAPRTKM